MDAKKQPIAVLSHTDILGLIPHRYPFLLIDRVKIIEAQKSAIGIKAITNNEPQMEGHFPGYPIMPGVLIIESIAQTAAVIIAHNNPQLDDASIEAVQKGSARVYLVGVDSAKFRRPALPGDVLEFHTELTSSKRDLYKFEASVMCDGELVAKAVVTAVYRVEE
ncbi:MAG: 3-hydroxyacyl-ACP dehydratase FabZ [Proteobacteria bacterium]|nr:3-hydroxyacyl-ACP dehydratase FabZ [Pseudomonadota bacterium]